MQKFRMNMSNGAFHEFLPIQSHCGGHAIKYVQSNGKHVKLEQFRTWIYKILEIQVYQSIFICVKRSRL